MEAFILSAVEQGVMTITLNRPDRLNSFNDLMHHQLAECLKQAERDDGVRCLLITGAGRGFCAGQDLNDRNVRYRAGRAFGEICDGVQQARPGAGLRR